jgi:lysophospholipase L1-like esterase
MRILFQGDSITDAGRDKRNYHDMGRGYPKFASQKLREAFPHKELEFINLGISGNRTSQLFDRLYADAIQLQPDVISIMIGINDVWHRHNSNMILTSDEQIALNYRSILKRLKNETNAKIVMIAPYLLEAADKEGIREDLKTVHPIIEGLAREFADVYIPLNEHFAEALKTQPEPKYYSADGVHPNENGARFIGDLYAEALKPLINSL